LLKGLKSFAGAFKLSIGDAGIVYDPEPGVADSGIMDEDLTQYRSVSWCSFDFGPSQASH
jgi:hypothetical protein